MVKYIWQKPDWIEFTWRSDMILGMLAQARKHQGHILAQADLLDLKDVSEIIIDEVISTSEIEGEKLDVSSVRSSVAKRLGLPTAGLPSSTKQSDAIVEVLIDATSNYDEELTGDRLCGWQAALFPTGYSGMHKIDVGKFRVGEEPMQVVSGAVGKEVIHYVAPPSKEVPKEINKFLKWWRNSEGIDGIIRAAIAHLWFVSIHPFDDGNGRVTRAITDMALAQDEKTSKRLYSLSSEIMKERKAYYDILEKTQKGDGDITDWLVWFLEIFIKAIESSEVLIKRSMFMNRFYKHFAGISLNNRQSKVIKKLLESYPREFVGGMTNKKYVSIANTTPESAKRDIKDLVEKGLLLKNKGGGRSTSYRLNIELKSLSN